MNLRIADGAGLVSFLHGVVSASGTPVLSVGGLVVTNVDGRLVFYHGDEPFSGGRAVRGAGDACTLELHQVLGNERLVGHLAAGHPVRAVAASVSPVVDDDRDDVAVATRESQRRRGRAPRHARTSGSAPRARRRATSASL